MKSTAYEMILWWSNEDDCYVVDVPELTGCMAHGSTRAEAIQNAEEAISLWVQTAREDGIRVPKPKGRLLFA